MSDKIQPADLPLISQNLLPSAAGLCRTPTAALAWDDGVSISKIIPNEQGYSDFKKYQTLDPSRTVCDWASEGGVLSAAVGTFALDSTVLCQGLPAVKATLTNSANTFVGKYTYTNPVSFAQFKNITIPIRITSNQHAVTGINTPGGQGLFTVRLNLTGGTKTISLSVHTLDTAPGIFYEFNWNRAIDEGTAGAGNNFFTYTGSATLADLDTTGIDSIDLVVTYTGTVADQYPIWLGAIKLDCAAEDDCGIICWTFDGPYPSHLEIARHLNETGTPAVFAVRKELVNNVSGLTEAQMQTIYNAGHDFVYHCYASGKTNGFVNATDWPTSKSITDDFQNMWAYFRTMGWRRGIGYAVRAFSDMFPATTATARQVLIRDGLLAAGIKAMRGSGSVVSRKIPIGYGPNSTKLPILKYNTSTDNNTTLAGLVALIDRVAVTKEILIILCHGIDGGAGNQGLSSTIFRQALEYAKTKQGVKSMKFTDAAYKFYL